MANFNIILLILNYFKQSEEFVGYKYLLHPIFHSNLRTNEEKRNGTLELFNYQTVAETFNID